MFVGNRRETRTNDLADLTALWAFVGCGLRVSTMESDTFCARERTSSSGVSIDPMAPGVGTGNILEIAVIIVSTRSETG